MINCYMLALDPGVTPGFAVLDEHGTRLQSGRWRLQERASQGAGGRFLNLWALLDALVVTFPDIGTIAYELPGKLQHPRRGQGGKPLRDPVTQRVIMDDASPATHLGLFGVAAHIESWCESREYHYNAVAPGQVKKAITGKGNAAKRDVIEAIARRFTLDAALLDDNEADALAIGITGLVELGCIPPLVLTTPTPPRKRGKTKQTDERLVDDFYSET